MRLTSEYRRVKAIFNTPVDGEIKYDMKNGNVRTDFKVGPFVYKINFSPEYNDSSTISVAFELIDINTSDEELIRMMSKFRDIIYGDKIWTRPMSLSEAMDLKRRVIEDYSYDELEVAGSYAIKIFGAVLNIVKDYIKKYTPKCMAFTAASKNRLRIYKRLAKSVFSGARIKVRKGPPGMGVEVIVCLA